VAGALPVTAAPPRVTVAIPTRDRWSLLARALRTALAQEGVELEVVVVDDGSADPAPEALPGLADGRVRLVRHPEPRGVAAARNTGIAEARGEWIAFLDDDDVWSPRKLRRQLEAVRAADANFAYAGVVSIDGTGTVLRGYPLPAPESLRVELLSRCAIPAGSSNVLVQTELMCSLGGFDERFGTLADWDCWIRLAWAGRAAVAPEVLVAYLEHFDGMSLRYPRRAFEELRRLDSKYRALRAEHGVDIDRVAFAHDVAWLQLRRRRHGSAAGVYLRSALSNRRPQDLVPAVRFALRALLPVQRSLRGGEQPVLPVPDWLELSR
jgi:glycosyltransferase involved in cell wall biosynthesis